VSEPVNVAAVRASLVRSVALQVSRCNGVEHHRNLAMDPSRINPDSLDMDTSKAWLSLRFAVDPPRHIT
jgi:hypothetical protein